MTLKAVIGRTTTIQAKVLNDSGRLSSQSPITLKNQVNEIQSIEDIRDVEEIEVVDGATIIYNSETDKYEIRQLEAEDFGGALNLDGGTF